MDALGWCRERVLVPGNPLTASVLFAEPARRDQLLVLRTLIAELGAAAEASEGQVVQTKLQWWRDALSGTQPAAQRHPLIQALDNTGVLDQLGFDLLSPLIEAIAELAENPRFERMGEVWHLSEKIGGQAAVLEGRLLGGAGGVLEQLKAVGAAAYQVRMTRDIALDARANRWWVPLELQADYQVSRSDVAEGKPSRGFDGLVRSLIHDALKRAQTATNEMRDEDAWTHRHALIYWNLDRRLALKLARKPARLLERRLLLSHSANVWSAWRCARQLRKRVGAP